MLVLGGAENAEGHVFSLNLKTMEWSKISNVNYIRCAHTANVLNNDVYLFGGLNEYT